MMLADLDESAWTLFDRQTCLELAGEVVAAVSRAARAPLPIGDRPLPILPAGLNLADLDLEVRTVNCLIAAGIHERPQDLNGMTIDGLLNFRGFWSKSLVDLLTAMEHAVDHPQAQQGPREENRIPVKPAHTPNRYPRVGHRIAPSLLRPLLEEPIPSRLAQGPPLAGACLADLDETVWKSLSPQAIAELAGMVVSRVGAGVSNRDIHQFRLPAVPAGLRLEDLRLETRTYNCLKRLGVARNMQRLGSMTVGSLMHTPAFGAKCLVDLLTAVETLTTRGQRIGVELSEYAEKLVQVPEALAVHFSDPRLGRLLRAMDSESNTVSEFVERLRLHKLDLTEPFRLAEGIGQVVEWVRRFQELPVEEELKDVFAPMANERDRQILASYYNWDGEGGRTLEYLGRKYGLSRERIRQICMRCVNRIRHLPVFAPVLDQTLRFIADRLPAETGTLERALREAGLSHHGLSIAAIEEAAGFFSRHPGFRVVPVAERALAVEPGQAELPPRIVRAARAAVGSFGVANVTAVQAKLGRGRSRRRASAQLLHETLGSLKDFQWLDTRQYWFRLETPPQYGLPNMIEKVVSVAERIHVSRLRAVMGRYRRSRTLPPTAPLLKYCRQMPSIRVEGNAVCAGPSLDWRTVLGEVERTMVEVLKEHGPVMDRAEFEEQCLRRGMNRFTFNAILVCSPVVTHYGWSIYGLVAQKTNPKTVRRARARGAQIAPRRVLQKCGMEADDRPFVVYRLSKAVIAGGVITIPATLKHAIAGEYAVLSPKNKRLGRMMAKRECGWGLGPALRGSGAKPGNYLLIRFHNADRTAVFHLGDERLAAEHPQAADAAK